MMIDKKDIDYQKAVELILLYEESVEYSSDYVVNLCKTAMENENSEDEISEVEKVKED